MELINPHNKIKLFFSEAGLTDNSGNYFPVINSIPRFVSDENYSSSFGFQWNRFVQTQIDRVKNQLTQSYERFFKVTGWDKEDLTGKYILEAGCGAGRFSQIVLDYTKAILYSFDYSNAVEANLKNNGHHGDRLKLFQANIYEMPFPDNSFDKVFCFGVLQHTPDVKKSVQCLIQKVKPGGEVVVDFYPIKGWWTKIHIKYLLRPFTKKMNHEKLLRLIERNIDWMIVAAKFFKKAGLGKMVNRFIPLCGLDTLPENLNKEHFREWCILDTFDMFSPAYDNPQKISTVKKWFEEYGMEVTFAGFISVGSKNTVAVVKGIKKNS
ncbi:MAG: class I SAM-dependent methyltransferase [Chitinophagaceae bacterium]|nr:class I SAM-dependent methyltransferase [Chitinophagaceae bacterium]